MTKAIYEICAGRVYQTLSDVLSEMLLYNIDASDMEVLAHFQWDDFRGGWVLKPHRATTL